MYTLRLHEKFAQCRIILFCLVAVVCYSLLSCNDTEIPGGVIRNSGAGSFGANFFPSMETIPTSSTKLISQGSDSLGFVGNPLALSGNAVATLTSDGAIALFLNDELHWKTPIPDGAAVSDICAGADNTLFVVGQQGTLFAFHQEGSLKWKTSLTKQPLSYAALTIMEDRLLIVADSVLYVVLFDGRIYRKTQFSTTLLPFVAVHNEGFTAVAMRTTRGDSIVMLSKKGDKLWGRLLSSAQIVATPAFGNKVLVATGVVQNNEDSVGVVHVFDKVGAVSWSVQVPCLPVAQAIGDNDEIFVTGKNKTPRFTSEGLVVRLSADGKSVNYTQIHGIPRYIMLTRQELAVVANRPADSTIAWFTGEREAQELTEYNVDIPLRIVSSPAVSPFNDAIYLLSKTSNQGVVLQ